VNLIGEHVGNYVVTRELGSGGMGTVYLAEHPVLGRKVAIKVLHDEHASDPDTVARFFQEARAAAEIGEEHIIEVIDFGDLMVGGGKAVYLMMELLDGMSLGKRLQQGPMPMDEVAQVAGQVCLALGASHEKGIIHRDLKPENIYLCPRPSNPLFVKVLDFGIAKLTGPKASARTRAGTILGTPAYMSPEQCRAERDIDARADIYALGVVMFEMLTGQLPFSGVLGQLLEGHLQNAPDPPSRRNSTITPAWDAIVLHCLEKERDERFPSMAALAAAIRDPAAHLIAYQQQRASHVARPPAPRRTVVLPIEMPSPLGSALATPYPAVAIPSASVPEQAVWSASPRFVPMPAAKAAEIGTAPTLSLSPTPAPFTSPVPLGTPGPFPVPVLPPAASVSPPAPAADPVVPPAAPRSRGKAWRLVLVAAAVAAVVGGAVFGISVALRSHPDERASAPAAITAPIDAASPMLAPDAAVAVVVPPTIDAMVAIAPDAPPVAVEPARVRISITSTPEGARVTVRHGATLDHGVTPYALDVERGTAPATITVAARGYASVTQTLVPRVDADVVVVLKPVPRDPPRRRPPKASDELIRPE